MLRGEPNQPLHLTAPAPDSHRRLALVYRVSRVLQVSGKRYADS